MLHVRFAIYRNSMFWVVAGLTAIALLLGLGLAYFSSDLDTLFRNQQSYRDYNTTLNDLLYNLTTAETGQRGYILTQNGDYLTPYTNSLPAIKKDLDTLSQSPVSAPYHSQIKRLNDLSNQKLSELQATVTAEQTQGQAAAMAIINTNVGFNDMHELHEIISQISTAQDKKLQGQINVSEQRTEILRYIAPVLAVVDIVLIVTILYLTQKAVRKEQQLENLKEQFVALASHQLRTPATAVKQYISLLLGGSFGKLKKEQEDVLEIINDSNERGIRIANSLLNITRVDSGKAVISEDPFDLSQFLRHVLTHYESAIKESRDQKLVVKMPKSPIVARVDQFYIRLIFENLIENASKYSDDGKKIEVTLKEAGNNIIFIVKDQGQGIKKEDIQLLFRKFSRLNQAVKKADGSGLGLYLVKQAAELHGGDVRVTSTPGKGSTFTVTIKKDPAI